MVREKLREAKIVLQQLRLEKQTNKIDAQTNKIDVEIARLTAKREGKAVIREKRNQLKSLKQEFRKNRFRKTRRLIRGAKALSTKAGQSNAARRTTSRIAKGLDNWFSPYNKPKRKTTRKRTYNKPKRKTTRKRTYRKS